MSAVVKMDERIAKRIAINYMHIFVEEGFEAANEWLDALDRRVPEHRKQVAEWVKALQQEQGA